MTKMGKQIRRIVTPRRAVAVFWMAAVGLWPQVARTAGNQDAEGATQTLPSMPDGLLDPWCGLDALTLGSCSGLFHCGEVKVPCGPMVGGLMLAAKGVGMRNSDTGTIVFRGVPAGAVRVVAWLFWGLITDSPEDPVSRKVIFEGASFMGERLGSAEEPCWMDSGSSAIFEGYWAEVTSMLTPRINGDYSVILPGSSVTDGSSAFDSPPGAPLPLGAGRYVAEGISLVVAYSHPKFTLDSRIEMHVKPIFFAADDIFNHNLAMPLPGADRVLSLRIGGGGQRRTSSGAVAGFKTSIDLGGGRVVLLGDGSAIDVHADWQGADGDFWDTQVTVADASLLNYQAGSSFYRMWLEAVDIPQGPFWSYNCGNSLVNALVAFSRAQ